jgi:aminomethyltransferase
MQRTPLYQAHIDANGKMVDFGGWEMPLNYGSQIQEHRQVRTGAGMFDVSHMCAVFVSGASAVNFLNWVLTNNVCDLEHGQAQYSLMCNQSGGVVDDLYTYRVGPDKFLLIINASRIGPDMNWLQEKLTEFEERDHVSLKNASSGYAAVAVQGPAVAGFIDDAIAGSGGIA